MSSTDNSNIDFGFQTVNKQEKQKLVKDVFDSVALKYDLMNDLTSFGIHRIWKNELINWISPQKNQKLADIAGGTGDIARKFIEYGGGSAYVIDVNFEMISAGLKHKENNINMHWVAASAENIPIPDNSFDRASIAFGLRNITNRDLALKEILKLLVFFAFVKITGNKEAYLYLVESIRMFPKQIELSEMFSKAGFSRIRYRNLSNGIVALHSGWKF